MYSGVALQVIVAVALDGWLPLILEEADRRGLITPEYAWFLVEGKSMLTCSDLTISHVHNGTFVVANLVMAVLVLASLPAPSIELVNISRYTKLVGAYSWVVANSTHLFWGKSNFCFYLLESCEVGDR